MKGLNYQIIECNIRILEVQIQKLRIKGEHLLLTKPPFFCKERLKEWNKKIDDIFNEEVKIQDELINEYLELEKILEKNGL